MKTLLGNAFGLIFLVIGVGYLRRPDIVANVYALLRETLFSEEHIALDRKKWALFFLLLSLLCFYWGMGISL